ncbi:MAG: hypothetical protein M3R38_16290 [Actinomycetota bacterium]|nr:hypothetical protein [Actinomycetota bacterium]
MDSRDVRLAARDLGIRLSVTKDDELRCEPADRLTPELRASIRDNREDLLYDVLLADALRYVAVERHVEGADPGAVLDAHQDAIDAAYLARDWPAYRASIRAFVRAGLREIERAKRAMEKAAESLAAPGEPQSDALRADRDRRAIAPWVRSRRRERGVLEPAGAGAARGD